MKNLLLILLVLLALPVAHAGVNIEPYLGYLSGSSERSVSGTQTEWSYATPMIGARLGYGSLGLSFGLDYSRSLSPYDMDQDTPATTGASDEVTSTNLGLYLGYKFPILVRVWGTYFLNNKFEVDAKGNTSSNNGDSWEGKGYSLGAGWTGFPFIAINLEYRMLTFDKFKNGSTGVETTYPVGASTDLDSKEFLLSISLPLDF